MPPKISSIHISWKQMLVIFVMLLFFQIFISQQERDTLRNLLAETMDWYKQNSAEQIANIVAGSIEVLLEQEPLRGDYENEKRTKSFVHALNSILKQPLMKRNVEAICIIVPVKDTFIAIDHGRDLYNFFYGRIAESAVINPNYAFALKKYKEVYSDMIKSELITSFQEGQNIFHVYVPLVPYGECIGAVYLKIHPDVSLISQQILAGFNKTVFVFSILILLGLMVLFYISTYIVLERDKVWECLTLEMEARVKEQIAQKKERLFTKRIYHTHHKAEKVMGFIIEDISRLDNDNSNEIKYRISKYANFVARVIYDMKWYSPPIGVIRNPLFKTNINEVLKFIVENIFLRVSNTLHNVKFHLELDKAVPYVSVNEFVIWEIVEPLIQNSIDHAGKDNIEIYIRTKYLPSENRSMLEISDNGKGIRPDLLELDENGIKKIFVENISTKEEEHRNCGYGCFLAYEIAKRCGWELDGVNILENNTIAGCKFILKIYH